MYCFLLGILPGVSGQQAAQSSLYMLNPFQWNAGFAGLQPGMSAIAGVRKQWSGLEGSPATQYANVHAPFEILGGGIGIKLENDIYGAERNSSAFLAYSYQIPLGQGVLGFGLGAGLAQRRLDGAQLRTPEGFYRDNITDHRDAILPINLVQGIAPTFEAGVFFSSELLEAGISARHLTQPAIDLITFQSTLERTYFAHLNFNLELSRMLSLHPVIWVRSNQIQTQTDAGLILRYNNNISMGTSFRGYNSNSIDAISFIAGFQLSEKLGLAYAYDLTLSPLQQVSNGSHEMMLVYRLDKVFGKLRLPPIIYNPRNL